MVFWQSGCAALPPPESVQTITFSGSVAAKDWMIVLVFNSPDGFSISFSLKVAHWTVALPNDRLIVRARQLHLLQLMLIASLGTLQGLVVPAYSYMQKS